MVKLRINPIEVNRDPNLGVSMMEVNKDLNIENKLVLLPEANKWVLILVFLLGDSDHVDFNEGFNSRYSPPTFPSPEI